MSLKTPERSTTDRDYWEGSGSELDEAEEEGEPSSPVVEVDVHDPLSTGILPTVSLFHR